MTRDQAFARLTKLAGGARDAVRLEVEYFCKGISSPERRAEAATALEVVKAQHEAAKAEYDRIIREHPELQRLAAVKRDTYREQERLAHEKHYYKFIAWRRRGITLCDQVHGDTWEDAIASADQKWR